MGINRWTPGMTFDEWAPAVPALQTKRDREIADAVAHRAALFELGMVERFHRDVIGIAPAEGPNMDPAECMRRARLIAEEAAETVAALIGGSAAMTLGVEMAHKVQGREPSLVEYCDGAADLRVVLHGTDLMLGVYPLSSVIFGTVMQSNLAKAGGPKDPVTGKQLKPPGWTPPDVAGILKRELGWEEK